MNFSVRGKEKKTFIIDAGLRIDVSRRLPLRPSMMNVPIMKHVKEMRFDDTSQLLQGELATGRKFYTPHNVTTIHDVPKNSFVGSKGIICDTMYIYLISDEGKPLDFLGGNKEGLEPPLQTFLREAREETAVVIDPGEVFSLGVSDTSEIGVFARSFLFGLYLRADHPLRTKLVGVPIDFFLLKYNGHEYQPWVGRIINHVVEQIGTLFNLSWMLKAYRGFDFGEVCDLSFFQKRDGQYPPMIRKVVLLNEKIRYASSIRNRIGVATSLQSVIKIGQENLVEQYVHHNTVAVTNKATILDQEILRELDELVFSKYREHPKYEISRTVVDCGVGFISSVLFAGNTYAAITPSLSKIAARRAVARIALSDINQWKSIMKYSSSGEGGEFVTSRMAIQSSVQINSQDSAKKT